MLSSVYYVRKKLLVSKYTAIIQLIYGQLTEAVSIYARAKEKKYLEKKYIPLSKGKSDIKISYISGVALHLSKSHNSEPFSIASSIASDLLADFSTYLLIEVLPSGLICIEVSDAFLAIWLQQFIYDRKVKKAEVPAFKFKAGSKQILVAQFSDSVFYMQQLHAKCCSLLKLAEQEKLINSNTFSPQSISLLSSNRELYLNHPAERRLICSLVKLMDELEPLIARPLRWQGAALNLAKAFEYFWSTCRIHGNLQVTTPEIVMLRIVLIMVTQSVSRFLLEEKLNVSAFSEL